MKSRVSSINCLITLLAISCALLPGPLPAWCSPVSSNSLADSDVADDTLLLLLAVHTDREKAKATAWNELNATTLADIHVDGDDYSILQLQPQVGQRDATLSKIKAMQKQHPEFKSVTRNYRAIGHQQPGSGSNASSSTNSLVPNDLDFSVQWPLASMNWPKAWSTFHSQQKRSAHLTIVGTSCTPVPGNLELGQYIQEYNCLAAKPYNEGLQPPGSLEGNIDSSLTGCLTNNFSLLAGAAGFNPTYPCHVTIARICDPPDNESTSLSNIYLGVAWAINNQKIRGGPGPVNLSYNHHSDPCGQSAFQLDYILQELAASLLRQGDVLVESAGDTDCTNTLSPNGTGSIVLVQGTDQNINFYSKLTQVTNDPVAAPGAPQPFLYLGSLHYNYGTSFAAPLWTSAIAMVMAFNPKLTALQAHNIVLRTGTSVNGAAWPAVIPNFYQAINTALHQ